MAVSFEMLGILLMLDVCFLVNFFGIWALWKWIDTVGKLEQTAKENEEDNDLSQQENHSSRDTKSLEDVILAWCLGTVGLEPLRVQRFQNWNPLPGQIGIWTTFFCGTWQHLTFSGIHG